MLLITRLHQFHIIPRHPQALNFPSSFFRRYTNIFIEVLCPFVAADFHSQLHRRTGQEFFSTKRPSGSVRGDLFILRLDDFNCLVTFFVGKFNTLVNPASLPIVSICRLNLGLESAGILSWNCLVKISLASFLNGIITQWSDFSCFLYSGSNQRTLVDKSDHRVVIPLRSIAHDIFVTKFRGKIPRPSNAAFNDDIKRVCEIAEINESIRFSYKKVTETLRK